MPRIPVRRRSLAAALLAVAILIGLFAARPPPMPSKPNQPPLRRWRRRPHSGDLSSGAKPTIVLVHGAWADSSSWTGVVTRLQRRAITSSRHPIRYAASPATPRTSGRSLPPYRARSFWSDTPTAAP